MWEILFKYKLKFFTLNFMKHLCKCL